MDKPFNVGDKVFDIRKGNGTIVRISSYGGFPLVVLFNDAELIYTHDGKVYDTDLGQSLYHGHDLIVTVGEPKYEWQILYKHINKDCWSLSGDFYKTIDDFIKVLPYPENLYELSLFEPSKRICN